MDERVWIVNKSHKELEVTSMDLRKVLTFRPFIPQHLDRYVAMKFQKNYRTLSIIADPENYFKGQKMKQLIVRDAGIGDLLMVEPIIRQLDKNGNRDITIYSGSPEVFENNPHVAGNLKMDTKDALDINLKEYDAWEDLRNYSETCKNRDSKHRTDCYNQKFDLEITDKEPRLYFREGEKSKLQKKGRVKKHIGLVCDASHDYRRYDRWRELIDVILKDDNNVIVLIGSWKFMKPRRSIRIKDYQEKLTVRELILLIKNLDGLISVDSGPMHIGMTLHIPTVGIFSIIKPELRDKYYTGPKSIAYREDLPCAGCGSLHMADCKHGSKKEDVTFQAPCMQIDPSEIYRKLKGLKFDAGGARILKGGNRTSEPEKAPPEASTPHIRPNGGGQAPGVVYPGKKLTLPIIVQNEERNLPRFIDLVIKHRSIGKVIAVDGGSTDKTVEILRKAGAHVYVHPYDPNYHDMQALQRNIACSFVRDGEKILIMDPDECFSRELSDYLPVLAGSDIVYGVISRRTFEYYRDIANPEKQIKEHPDYQPRFYTWNRRFKFVGSPHHITYNVPELVKIDKDIIHFEREGKDREALEEKWSKMHRETKKIYA